MVQQCDKGQSSQAGRQAIFSLKLNRAAGVYRVRAEVASLYLARLFFTAPRVSERLRLRPGTALRV